MITVTKTYRTIDDLLKEIRAQFPDELIQIRGPINDDVCDDSLLFLNGLKTRLRFSNHRITPEMLESETFRIKGYDELLALFTYEIKQLLAVKMIDRRKEIQTIYEVEERKVMK